MKNRQIIYLINAITVMLCLLSQSLVAQKPEIVAVGRIQGSMDQAVLLKGSSFGTDATKLAVFFGAQRATIVGVTNQLLEVRIPPGATYDNITVTNTTNNLTGYSAPQFLLSFSGKHPFDATKLGTQSNFTAGDELYDHCLCDFNNDGKVDIATANRSSTSISILQNTSTGVGNINFTTIQKSIGASSLQIKCGDLNGDGLSDLVVTEGTKLATDTRIFILQNTGSFNFSQQSVTLTGQKTSKIEIADLDNDGKPEVLVTDQANGKIAVLKNQSAGAIAFAAPVNITVPATVSTDGIDIEDLNGDQLPDIIVSQFGTSPSNLYTAANISTPGSINFSSFTKFDLDDAVRDIRIGDIDGDRKPDVAATQFLNGNVVVFLNTSSGSAISLSKKPGIVVQTGAWGLDFGDVDGDGKLDIVTASVAATKLSILNNESTPGNVAFVKTDVTTTFITRHVRIGDLDGDGKPDISFCSVDKSGIPASKISVFRNQSCVVPEILPAKTPIQLCSGALPYKLVATASNGSFYQWFKDGVQVSCGLNQNTFDVTSATGTGKYSVKILAEGSTCAIAGSCSEESGQIDITIGASSAPVVNPGNNGPVCIGSTLNLSIGNNVGDSYAWTGPEGFTATGTSPSVPNFQLANAGKYEVEVTKGGCVASRESTVVEAIDVPSFVIGYSGSTTLCQGDPAKTLSVVPAPGTFTYQWFKDGTAIGGATSSTYSVTTVAASAGDYTAKASYSGCATIETPKVTIAIVVPATATITAPTSACKGQKVSFSAANNAGAVKYHWDFGDGQTTDVQNPDHIFAVANPAYNVVLTVSYDGACAATDSHSLEVTDAPAITITTDATDLTICDGETITFTLTDNTFTNPVWNTGATGFSITVGDAGKYSVTAKAANGCSLTAETGTVVLIPAPAIVITADPTQISEGETSQLTASGLQTYQWTPDDGTLDLANIPDPKASPVTTTTYTVTGVDENGCTGSASVEVHVKGEAIVSKLVPKNFFSPNNSGPNELWLVENIEDYPQCAVTIYDDKGVKVFTAKPYGNDWNGMFNGKALPDGVYFYVIRCDGEENSPRTGSITLIR